MNHCVPDFEMEDDDSIATSVGLARQKKSSLHQDDVVELLWQNGPVVMQSQNHRSLKKLSSLPKMPVEDAVTPAGASAAGEIQPSAAADDDAANRLFMQEDELASWLHYPLDDSFDRDFCSDLLYPAPSSNYAISGRTNQIPEDRRPEDKLPMPPRPPIPPARRAELDSSAKFHNFAHFSRPKARNESRPSTLGKTDWESTVVDSSDTPAVHPRSTVSRGVGSTPPGSGVNFSSSEATETAATGTLDRVTESGPPELAVTSSSGGSGASASASGEPSHKPPADDRKRKARESDDNECHSEDAEFECVNAKKQACGSTSARRARAAEVHNLSERRRRDRINEKMKALQELIPRCNKSDKASMLDEAIEYLKSLQLQVQMMSMGCSMLPMMFPGVQQFMPPMGMGMGIGMDMGMSRPMLPFPSVLAGSAIPTPVPATHLAPRLTIPAFHLPNMPPADLSRISAGNQSDPALNSIGAQSLNQPWIPNFTDPYQHYIALQRAQVPPPQNQAIPQPSISKGVENPENHQTG